MTYRTTGVATYRNYDFFGLIEGLNFAAQYQGKNERTDNSHLYGAHGTRVPTVTVSVSPQLMFMMALVSVRYIPNPIGQMRRKEPLLILSMPPVRMRTWATGVKYDANNIYFAANYAETLNMTTYGDGYISNKAQSFEVVAQYQFDFGLRPSLAYLKSKGRNCWLLRRPGHD